MHQNTITMKNEWTYNGQRFTTADIGDWYGFVYRITNLTNGMDYIGRKYFKTVRKLNPLKGFGIFLDLLLFNIKFNALYKV